MTARVALIALKEDDFGVDANLQFCQHGPRVPRSLFRRAVAGVPQALTRAKVAEFFMENVNDCIRNLRYNQNLDDPGAVAYVNLAKKKTRSTLIEGFDDVHEELKRWSDSCVNPFTAIIWVDANWQAFSNTPRRIVMTRPLLLQATSKPFFRPMSDPLPGANSAKDGGGGGGGGGGDAMRLSRVYPGGGGGSLNVKPNKENRKPWKKRGFSEAVVKRRKVPAPGSIYALLGRNQTPGANAYGLGPALADAAIRPHSRSARLNGRMQGGFLEMAIRQSSTPGPSYMGGSSFQVQKTSRPRPSSTVMPIERSSTRCTSRASHVARRPATVGNTSPRAVQGRASRFLKSQRDQGICFQPKVTKAKMFILKKVDAPGPRYYLPGGIGSGLGGGGGKQAKPRFRGGFSRSPRF
jgi:hypothetical protein